MGGELLGDAHLPQHPRSQTPALVLFRRVHGTALMVGVFIGTFVGITRKGQDHLRPALQTYAASVRRHYLAPLTREQMTALGDSTRRVGDPLKRKGLFAAS